MIVNCAATSIMCSVIRYAKEAEMLVIEHDGKPQKRNLVNNKNKQRQVNERNKLLGNY